MKKMIVLALMLFGFNTYAQTTKLLMFCDYYTPNQSGDIYVDVYLDYDAATDTYSNIEAGIVETENAVYPDYLWALNLVYTAGNASAKITIERDLDTLSFEMPTVAKANATVPSYAIPKSTVGAVEDFNVRMTGFYLGKSVDQDFICYDPSTKANQSAPR
jgi:hypothetical protein